MKGANNNTITIIVTYILAVVYCLLFLNSIIKIKILGKFGKDAHVARLFFICLSSQVFLDTLFYSLLPSSNSSQIISILLLQLPSSLNMFTYSLLFLQTLDYTFKTHLQLGSTFKRDKRRLQFHKYTYIGVITIMIAYVLVELTFFIIILIYPNQQDVFMLQLASITLVFVVSYGGIIVYQVIYFSGTPFKSTTEQLKMKRLLWVFSLWTLCQIPKPILSLAKINIIPDPDNIPNDQDLKQAVCIFILQIMTEVMPFLLSMEGNFLSIFTTAFKVQDIDNSMSEGLHQVIQTQIVSEQELLNHIAHEGTEDHEYQVQFTKVKLVSTEIARQIQILQDIKIVVTPEDVQKGLHTP
ncbi:hypothetical protein FGO68_gene9250 [Halteria grandinella]|uniref:Uncharacterized protein n=1 Tax=Halteria grandinella TaxID=5974 RepID=A0A8J8T463_HALGN|nr:hypothetical protein FGO68_gene9250 [Halteria grandinella]